jgi:hypothetical protein
LLPSTVERRVKNLIIFAGPGTTLAISPWFNLDPINLIKVLVLTCSSFAALGLLIPYLPMVINKVGKSNFLILFFFITALFLHFFSVVLVSHNSSGVYLEEIQEYFLILLFWQFSLLPLQ